MTLPELQEQIVDLQSRLLFQEDALQKLDDVVIDQAQTITKLQERVAELEQQVDTLKFEGEQKAGEERPPHY